MADRCTRGYGLGSKTRKAPVADIAVIGPGAIGSTIAVRLLQRPSHTLTRCARSPVECLTLETAEGLLTTRPTILTAPQQGRPCDWVFLATKAYDAAAAAAWLPYLAGPDTPVAILQNGVEHAERFRPYLAEHRIVPVVVNIPVERVAPGTFRQTRHAQLTVADTAHGRAFAELFLDSGIAVAVSPDFLTEAWKKLALNCAGAVSALVLKPAGVSRLPGVAEIMRALALECMAVGRAEGATLDDDWAEAVLHSYQAGPPDAVNSLHADRLAGRPIEIDARNGAVVRLGRKHGVPTPANQMIVTLPEAAV